MNKGKLLKIVLPAVVVATIAIGGGTFGYISHQKNVVNANVVKVTHELGPVQTKTENDFKNIGKTKSEDLAQNIKTLDSIATQLQADIDSGYANKGDINGMQKDIVISKYYSNMNKFMQAVLAIKPDYDAFMSIVNSNQTPTSEQVTNLVTKLQGVANNSSLAEASTIYANNKSDFSVSGESPAQVKTEIEKMIAELQQAEAKQQAYNSMINDMAGLNGNATQQTQTQQSGQVSQAEIEAGNTKAYQYPILAKIANDGTIQGVVANTGVTFTFNDGYNMSSSLTGTEQYKGDSTDVFKVVLVSDGNGNITVNETCNNKPTGTYNLTASNGTLSGTFTNLSNNKVSDATFSY